MSWLAEAGSREGKEEAPQVVSPKRKLSADAKLSKVMATKPRVATTPEIRDACSERVHGADFYRFQGMRNGACLRPKDLAKDDMKRLGYECLADHQTLNPDFDEQLALFAEGKRAKVPPRTYRKFGAYKTFKDLMRAVQASAPNDRCFYEIAQAGRRLRPYFDVEWYSDNKPEDHDEQAPVRLFTAHLRLAFAKIGVVLPTVDDVVDGTLCGSRASKGRWKSSFHLLPACCDFEDDTVLYDWVFGVVEPLLRKDPHMWFEDVDPKTGAKARKCIMDLGVYTTDREMRTPESCKAEDTSRTPLEMLAASTERGTNALAITTPSSCRNDSDNPLITRKKLEAMDWFAAFSNTSRRGTRSPRLPRVLRPKVEGAFETWVFAELTRVLRAAGDTVSTPTRIPQIGQSLGFDIVACENHTRGVRSLDSKRPPRPAEGDDGLCCPRNSHLDNCWLSVRLLEAKQTSVSVRYHCRPGSASCGGSSKGYRIGRIGPWPGAASAPAPPPATSAGDSKRGDPTPVVPPASTWDMTDPYTWHDFATHYMDSEVVYDSLQDVLDVVVPDLRRVARFLTMTTTCDLIVKDPMMRDYVKIVSTRISFKYLLRTQKVTALGTTIVQTTHSISWAAFIDTPAVRRSLTKNSAVVSIIKPPSYWSSEEHSKYHAAFNVWRGFRAKRLPAGVAIDQTRVGRFLMAVGHGLCSNHRENTRFVLSWLAHAAARPWELPMVAILVVGSTQGIGKGTVFNFMRDQVVGPQGGRTQSGMECLIPGAFNEWEEGCCFLTIDELSPPRGKTRQAADTLKFIITEPTRMLNEKNVKTGRSIPNCMSVVLTANSIAASSAYIDKDQRRIWPIESNPELLPASFWTEFHNDADCRAPTNYPLADHVYTYLLDFFDSEECLHQLNRTQNRPVTDLHQVMQEVHSEPVHDFLNEFCQGVEWVPWGVKAESVARPTADGLRMKPAWMIATALFGEYRDWCRDNGIRCDSVSVKSMAIMFKRHLGTKKVTKGNFYDLSSFDPARQPRQLKPDAAASTTDPP